MANTAPDSEPAAATAEGSIEDAEQIEVVVLKQLPSLKVDASLPGHASSPKAHGGLNSEGSFSAALQTAWSVGKILFSGECTSHLHHMCRGKQCGGR